jgi:hypothetical protein
MKLPSFNLPSFKLPEVEPTALIDGFLSVVAPVVTPTTSASATVTSAPAAASFSASLYKRDFANFRSSLCPPGSCSN